MKKILKSIFFILFLHFSNAALAQKVAIAGNDVIFPEIVAMSSSAAVVYNQGFPQEVTRTILSTDKVAFYYASLRIVNPTKSQYDIRIECVDNEGNLVISGDVKREPESSVGVELAGQNTNYIYATMGLSPKPGKMVQGQKIALQNGREYFVRLYVEGKFIALTNFRYVIVNNKK